MTVSLESQTTDWHVDPQRQGFVLDGGAQMSMGCHHSKGGKPRACGGCYARLVVALEHIRDGFLDAPADGPAFDIATAVLAELKAEGLRLK